MLWPNATDYNAAVQNPQLCFRDDDLRQGQAVGDLFGLPRPYSGNFADVYQILGADGQTWAVKCFIRPVTGLRPRYHAISEHLRQAQRAFMVEFHFLDEGICIRGQWHPLVKMRWVEGFRLNEFICEHLNKPALLDRLAQLWVRLAQELRDAGMAHGDLQHGNVLLVPDGKGNSLALKLVDYDGMFVPALADCPSGEVGHSNYQHPRRLHEGGYGPNMDRFAHLLIYTALRCLRVGGEKLWQRYDNQENLLFREEDFCLPSKSRLLHELWDISDRDIHNLVGHLLLASQGPLGAVPLLDELIDGSSIRPLSDGDEAWIKDLLNGGASDAPGEQAWASAPETRTLRTKAPGTKIRRAFAPPLTADPTTDAADPNDTKPLPLAPKTVPTPILPVPKTPRRSLAEIERDAQPPPLPADHAPPDAAAHADPLVSRLSHPAWLATLSVIALVSFLVINVMVWSSATKPATSGDIADAKTPISNIQVIISPKPRQEEKNPKPKQEEKDPKPKQEDTVPKSKQEDTVPIPKHENTAPKRSQGEQKQSLVSKPHGRREIVHFRTVDHAELAGTLYHGWKGKEGMTVLMLHDLGRSRSTPGWKRLAEVLQEEGHTVLTFDFRSHGESKRVSTAFWKHPVNKSLPTYVTILPAEKQTRQLEPTDLPPEYRPWLIEDIAAARTYLDLRHDEPSCPVNTFNLALIGAGQAAALGSLWLATEGLRYNGSEMGDKILLKFPEKLSFLQVVWIGMADPLKLSPFGIHSWLQGAHDKPVVPITYIYGEDDPDASNLLALPIRKKFGRKFVIPNARQSGQELLDTDPKATADIQQYLVKTLGSLPPPPPPSATPPVGWVPRNLKSLCSFWRIEIPGRRKQVLWFEAKRVGEETLLPVPFQQLGIPIKGLEEPSFIPGEAEQ